MKTITEQLEDLRNEYRAEHYLRGYAAAEANRWRAWLAERLLSEAEMLDAQYAMRDARKLRDSCRDKMRRLSARMARLSQATEA